MSEVACKISKTLAEIQDMLLSKNKSYGNSALDPVRIFSKVDSLEQLRCRIDDKLSRLSRGYEAPGEDVLLDLIGYLVLLLIGQRERKPRQAFVDEVADRMSKNDPSLSHDPSLSPLEKVGAKWIVD